MNRLPSARPWWQPVVFDYGRPELLVMRLLFAVLAIDMIKWKTGAFTTQKFPHGIAHFVNLTWLAQHPPGLFWQGLTIVGLLLYVAGWLPVLGLLPALFFAVTIGTLVTSQSQNVNHTWQLVTMILLAQFLVYAWPRKRSDLVRPDIDVHRLATYASTVIIAASYVVCGIVKLANSHFQWIQKVPNLSLQLLKSNWAGYYDTLHQPPEWLAKAAQAIVDYPNVARVFFGTGLLIELAGFVILISRRWAFFGGLAIIALHLSISKVMDLHFEYHMAAVLIFLVNLPGLRKTFAPVSIPGSSAL